MPNVRRRSRSKSRRSRSKSRCPRGMIMRKGYTRKGRSLGKRVRVAPVCIKDLGKPGKGPKLWTVRKGLLGRYGYKLDESALKRHKALTKAVRNESYATVIRQLNAVRNYTKLSQPANSRKYTADMRYVQNTLSRFSRSKSRKRSRRRSKK